MKPEAVKVCAAGYCSLKGYTAESVVYTITYTLTLSPENSYNMPCLIHLSGNVIADWIMFTGNVFFSSS